MSSQAGTVLIVDDDAALTDVYAAWLADDYPVETATSGAAALDVIDDHVDIVLLDRRMPGLSGDDVLAEIRADGHDCRVAMVTGVEPTTDVIAMGFDEYLVKPVDSGDLHRTVETLRDRLAYSDDLQELYALLSKRALLETNPDAADTDAYDDLDDRIDALRADLTDTVSEFSHDDFRAAFHDLTPQDPEGGANAN